MIRARLTTSTLRKLLLASVFCLMVSLCDASTIGAHQPLPSRIDLRPNVLLLIDQSPLMRAIVPESGYDLQANYPARDYRRLAPSPVSGRRTLVDIDSLDNTACPPGMTAGHLDSTTACLRLPVDHLFSPHYLDYLFDRFIDGSDLVTTLADGQPPIPNQSLFQAAQQGAVDLLQSSIDIRWCLATTGSTQPVSFPCGSDPDTMVEHIRSLTVDVVSVPGIDHAHPGIISWFAGDTPTSSGPIDYRCRANGMVLLTDAIESSTPIAEQLSAAATRDLIDHPTTDAAGESFGRPASSADAQIGDFPVQRISSYLLGSRSASNASAQSLQDAHGAAFAFQQSAQLIDTLQRTLAVHRPGRHISRRPMIVTGPGNQSLMLTTDYSAASLSGDLSSTALNVSNSGISANPVWIASQQIADHTHRSLWTSLPLTEPSDDNRRQRVAFDVESLQGNTTVASSLIEWVRGNPALEQINGGMWRDRASLLGPLINSNPVYVSSVPEAGYDDPDYLTFSSQTGSSGRPGLVYAVTSNGLLHGFNIEDGHEAFAYLPGFLLDDLPQIADSDRSLDPALGGAFVVEDVRVGEPGGGNPWHTLLIGSGGQNAVELFALDVTDPASGPKVLWESAMESSAHDDSGLRRHHAPSIVRVKTSDDNQRWFVVSADVSEDSAVMLLDPATGATDQRLKFADGGGNITSVVVIDLDHDSFADRLYAGDLSGRLWRADWHAATSEFVAMASSGGEPTPLFTASAVADDNGVTTVQPITGELEVGRATGRGRGQLTTNGAVIYFSAGPASPSAGQTLYAVIDDDVSSGLTRSDLTTRRLDHSETTTQSIRTLSTGSAASNSVRGWALDLTLTGEYLPTRPRLVFDRVQFETIAAASITNDPCAAPPRRFVIEVGAASGEQPQQPVFDIDQDGMIDSDDVAAEDLNPSGIELDPDAVPIEPFAADTPAGKTLVRGIHQPDGTILHHNAAIETRRLSWRRMPPE